MMAKAEIFIVLCLFVVQIYSWRFFHNGKVKFSNPQPAGDSRNFSRWFTQNLDHFDVTNNATWQQRYYVNDEFMNTTNRNVAFLLIGGEGEATDVWMTKGAWIEYAKRFNPILFQLEHRFYGKSRPTEDLSVENLKFLTSEQALADLPIFVSSMNEQYQLSPDVKWIAFGGSYPGSLAAWARLKYPHLIHGSISSSGPLLALPDFQEFFQVVARDLQDISAKCYNAVKRGTAQIKQLELSGNHSLITELFNLCDPIEDSEDKVKDFASLYSSLAGNFAGIAQYNKDNRLSTKGTLLGNITLDSLCAIMTDNTRTEVDRLARVNSLILTASNQTCFDVKYSNMINEMRNLSWDAETVEGGRQWTFQTCNEFGFFQTSDKKPQIFGNSFPLDFSIGQCQDIFGPEFDEDYLNKAVYRTNALYGALNIEVNNVVFVHGSVDPWHALGITSSTKLDAPAIYIKGTAHCANMYPPDENDLPQLKNARVMIEKYIASWL